MLLSVSVIILWLLLQDHRSTGSYNVALGKNTTASSVLNDKKTVWTADKAVDGNTNQDFNDDSCFHSQENATRKMEFLRVNLGNVYQINRFEIFFIKDTSVRQRSIHYSLMISNTTKMDGPYCYQDNTSIPRAFHLHQEQICEGIGQYVSIIQRHKSNEGGRSGPILEVCEFKVYGCPIGKYGNNCSSDCSKFCVNNICDPDNGTCTSGCEKDWSGDQCNETRNLAYMKNASSSPVLKTEWNALNTVDGNVNDNVYCNSCLHTSNTPGIPAFLTVHLGYTCTINKIDIYFVKYDQKGCTDQQQASTTVPGRSNGYSIILTTGSSKETCYEDRKRKDFGFIQSINCTGIADIVTIYQPNPMSESQSPGPILEICELKVFGCKIGMYGKKCNMNCPSNCKEKACDPDSGTCLEGCNAGWRGDRCNKTCSNGTYGYKCNNTCGQCRNEAFCNTETGACPNDLCERGVNGSKCDQGCMDGYYGYNCNESCGNCKNNSACDKQNGFCANGLCDKGYTGSLCSENCKDGSYGYNCNESCGHCKDNTPCDKQNGSCTDGLCDKGYNGSLCTETCIDGYYGYNCNESCGHCKDETACDKQNGSCSDGLCNEGYDGWLCSETCKDGSYGYNCNKSCGHCKNNTACDKRNGSCIDGLCDKGYNGSLCSETCPNGTYGYFCGNDCGQCRDNLACDNVNGICPNSVCERGFNGPLCTNKNVEQTAQVDNSPFIGGGIAGVIIIVLFVAVVFFLWRRKVSKRNTSNEQEFTDLARSTAMSGNDERKSSSGAYATIKKKETCIDEKDNQPNVVQLEEQYENIQLGKRLDKAYEMASNILADSVKEKENNENKLFKEEFEALPKGQLKPCQAAQMSPNRSKNRFKTTFPYDDTRIVLKIHGDDESDYINANYIKDKKGRKIYIASQGPRNHTVIDMWRMIWQEEVSYIVMLTNLQEKRSEKCSKYWPDLSNTITYGNISIKTLKEKVYSNYTIRVFHVVNLKTNSSREVTHYHYTTWPDHSVPESIDLVLFHNKVQREALSSNENSAPLLVHCSAGIGRTGTFIALDALLKHCRDEHSVNVFQFVKHMREEERMNMIQTVEQYIAIHYLLLEALRTRFYPIPKSNLKEEIKRMCSSIQPANQNVLRRQMSELNDLKPNYSDDDFTRGLQNQVLNVDPNLLPVDRYMLYLTTFVKERNNYINAVTVPTQTGLHSIVVTNHPKDNTTVDLIRLILDHGSCVVELSGDISDNQWYPAPVSTITYGPFEVERSELKVSATATCNVTESDITIIQKKDTTRHSFRLFETKTWPSGSSDVNGLKTLCGLVRGVMTLSGNSTNGKMVLISKDGVFRCDVFCAVYNALEQLDIDDEVDMFNIVRQLQIRRPQFIPTVEEYKLCFDAVSHDLESNNEAIYANV